MTTSPDLLFFVQMSAVVSGVVSVIVALYLSYGSYTKHRDRDDFSKRVESFKETIGTALGNVNANVIGLRQDFVFLLGDGHFVNQAERVAALLSRAKAIEAVREKEVAKLDEFLSSQPEVPEEIKSSLKQAIAVNREVIADFERVIGELEAELTPEKTAA